MNKISDEVRKVAQTIGRFYLDKYDGDYKKAEEQLRLLDISKIEVTEEVCKSCRCKGRVISITLTRVGLFIGNKGENIDKLGELFNCKVKIIEEMDSIYNHLIPYPIEDDWDIDWEIPDCYNDYNDDNYYWNDPPYMEYDRNY